MIEETLSLAALLCFALGAALAIAGFRVKLVRNVAYPCLAAGLGFLLKTLAIGAGCHYSRTHFFNSPSETAGLFAWALAFCYLLSLFISTARSLGALLLPFITLLLAAGLLLGRQSADPGVPANWLLAGHILSAFLGYSLFLTACGASLLYLEEVHLLRRKIFGVILSDLPSLERLGRLASWCTWVGWAIFTATLCTGIILTREAHKSVLQDPKILATEITWLVFLLLALGRATRFLHGRRAALFTLAGAVLVLATFAVSHPFATKGTGERSHIVPHRYFRAFETVSKYSAVEKTDPSSPSRKGRCENSPAIYRWVNMPRGRISAVGTAESAVPTGLAFIWRPFPSVKTLGYFHVVPTGRVDKDFCGAVLRAKSQEQRANT